MKTRLQRRKEKDSLNQAWKYLLLTVIGLFLLFKFGLPALINLAGFVGKIKSTNQPIEKQTGPAPTAPTLLPLPEATNSAKLVITGYSQPGYTIKLSRGGIKIEETVTDTDGNFEFKDILLKEGGNEFYAEAVNEQNVSGEASKTYLVVYDVIKPELTIDSPTANQQFFDKDSPITIKGQTDAGADLMVNNKFIRLDADGSFSTSWPLNEGDNQLDFVVRDPAGNETTQNLNVNYTP